MDFNEKEKSGNNQAEPSKKGNLPERLSAAEEEILKKYLGSETIDKNLEEEIDKLKWEIENVNKTFSPELKHPIKNEIETFLKSKNAATSNSTVSYFNHNSTENNKDISEK